MVQTIRIYWPQIMGRVTLSYDWPGVITDITIMDAPVAYLSQQAVG